MSHTDQLLSSESSIAANQRTALSEILWLEEAGPCKTWPSYVPWNVLDVGEWEGTWL